MLFLSRLPSASRRTLTRGTATAAVRVPPSGAESPAHAPASSAAGTAASSKHKTSASANASKTSAQSAAGKQEPAGAAEEGARKLAQKKPLRTRRPSISLVRPRHWNRPIIPGLIPAYDLALKLIREDAAKIQAEADDLRKRLQDNAVPAEQAEAEEKRLIILETMAKINLPDVRWKAANGLADMNEPVYRHLVEQRWRGEGALDLLMERLHQMNIIPDILPDFHPSFDVRMTAPHKRKARAKPVWKAVEPGVFLNTSMTMKPPRLYATTFHTDPRLYTMLMVDPDVPDVESASFTSFLHWLQPNIALPSTTQPLDFAASHTPYVPPHPAEGSPYHRYLIIFLPQSSEIQVAPQERAGFSVRKFAEEYGLRFDGGGAHMFRAIWDNTSAQVWKQFIKNPMPRYGVIPRVDPYAEFKGKSRYPPLQQNPAPGTPLAMEPQRLAD